MMRQYFGIRDKYPGSVVLFRLGDFYEVFGDDAKTVAAELGIVLTGRDAGAERIPMCGVPHHSVDGYIATLVARATRWSSLTRWRIRASPRVW